MYRTSTAVACGLSKALSKVKNEKLQYAASMLGEYMTNVYGDRGPIDSDACMQPYRS